MTAEQSTFMIDLHQVGMMLRFVRLAGVLYALNLFLTISIWLVLNYLGLIFLLIAMKACNLKVIVPTR